MKKTRKVQGKNIIGERVRQARSKCNPAVSQDDLAGRLATQGILLDRTAISRIENQSRYVMDYEAAAIAKALKVSVAWLFGEAATK
jgi:transcriptional regulator with XRE-family HTH domain